jgi:DNA polymerase
LCDGLTNPSKYEGGAFDSDHIGPWSRWQGSLDATLVVVGQDWGDVGYFRKYEGGEAERNRSNETLRELLSSIGIEINPPSATDDADGVVFLTNAILCLKEGGLGASVKPKWFTNCGRCFLKPIIEIISPKVVASLGEYAYRSIQRLYDLPRMSLRDAVEQEGGFLLPNGSLSFAMYHCSPRVLARYRSLAEQKADWKRVSGVL